jgi:glyceraldehyde-3-phosphate dehydrogenase/erythrose-4-phosphate dehydrogenase
VVDGSICDLVMTFDAGNEKTAELSAESVLAALQDFADNKIPRLLKINQRQSLISSYLIGKSNTSIVAPQQIFVAGNTVRVIAGYDNEYGYAYKLALASLECPLPKA